MHPHKSRPETVAPEAAKSFGGDNLHDSADPLSIGLMTTSEWFFFIEGYQSGCAWGVDEGRRQADAEAEARNRQAARIVHAMAEIPPRDPEADRAAAERRAARWSA